MIATPLTTEVTMLGWSVLLLIVHILAQAGSLTRDGGLSYAMSARDGEVAISLLTRRLTSALRNFLETYTGFVALALALQVTGEADSLGGWGAILWFWSRVAYLPIAAFGIPVIRSVVWLLSLVGILLMLLALVV